MTESTPKSRFAPGFFTAFAITWLSYATYYMGRKGLSVAKASITEDLGSDVLIGVETAYLAAYAVGQYVNGWLGDRVGAKWLIGIGMLISTIACLAFGFGSGHMIFLLAFTLNGFAQASGWPGNIKAMAEWTTRENRGSVMGLWATCYQVGGIVATAFAAKVLVWGWRPAMIAPAVVMGVVGVMVLLLLKPGPGSNPEVPPERNASANYTVDAQRRVMLNPILWSYGASYFCIKLIRYSLLFWLPYYLSQILGYEKETAGYLSTSFEIGGVAGTILMGWLSDKYRHIPRATLSAISLLGLALATLLYAKLGTSGIVLNFVLMALVGALLFAPDTLLSGAAAQDAGGPQAAAIAAGMVNGLGSIGAIAQEAVTRGVSKAYGWDALFVTFVALSVLGAVLLAPAIFQRKRDELSTGLRA